MYVCLCIRYDVLVRHVDQIEQGIIEPYPEVELRTESVAPQMDPIAEEGEEGSHIDEEVCLRIYVLYYYTNTYIVSKPQHKCYVLCIAIFHHYISCVYVIIIIL